MCLLRKERIVLRMQSIGNIPQRFVVLKSDYLLFEFACYKHIMFAYSFPLHNEFLDNRRLSMENMDDYELNGSPPDKRLRLEEHIPHNVVAQLPRGKFINLNQLIRRTSTLHLPMCL